MRTTFKTETETDVYLATLEDGNPHKTLFERHDEVTIIKHDLFDHTDEGSVSTHSILLDGSANRKIGLAKSLMVKPGDVIDLEVYAKYFDSDAGGMTAVLNTLASNLASGASGVVIDGVNAGTSSLPFADFLSGGRTSSDDPEAYLNYFVFDQNYELISSQSGFKQVGPSARETGNDVDHQKLSHSITIAKAGYVYIYLSNDDTVPFDVFFDDFKVTQHHTDIVSKVDYYPFGLTFASYSRPTATSQNFKYNGKEKVDALGLDWYDYQARYYDPALGRWHVVDPLADVMRRHSPYNYAFDNPIRYIDPDGMGPYNPIGDAVMGAWDFFTGNASGEVKFEAALRMLLPVDLINVMLKSGDPDATYTTEELTGAAKDAIGVGLTIATMGESKMATLSDDIAKVANKVDDVAKVTNKVDDVAKTARGTPGMLEKQPRGKGSVPKEQRPKPRMPSKAQQKAQYEADGGACTNCGNETPIDKTTQHHYPDRHADGGSQTVTTCKDCHENYLHKKD